MARNRYARDYELTVTFNEKGRGKTTSRYIGNPWYFVHPSQAAVLQKRMILILLAGWLGYIGAMLWESAAFHTLYICLPFAFTGVPLFMMTDLAVIFRGMREPMEHRHANRLNNRYPLLSVLLAVFPAFALAGEISVWVTGRAIWPGDLLFSVGALYLMLAGGYSFRQRNNVSAKEVKQSYSQPSGRE